MNVWIVYARRHLEVLMVDDGSTDSSGTICDEYAAKDLRFWVKHQENGGGGVARNALLSWVAESDSKYIVWIDADDFVALNYLEFLYQKMEAHPTYNIVQCGFTSDKVHFEEHSLDNTGSEYWSITDTEELMSEMQSGEHGMAFTVLWNKIYRKKVYHDVSVIITPEISGRIYNDINILWKIYLNAGNCLVFDKVLYYYRYVPTSVQHKKMTERKLEFLPLYFIVYTECRKLGYQKYADFLSERMLFSLANNLGHGKGEYEDYQKFYNAAKNIFNELQKRIIFHCCRIDLKLLYTLGSRFFITFRAYGRLYMSLRALKVRFIN